MKNPKKNLESSTKKEKVKNEERLKEMQENRRADLWSVLNNVNEDTAQTNQNGESSKFPIWFHEKSLFSGREFPVAEVFINGERVPFNNENSDLIKKQNPSTLKRRRNRSTGEKYPSSYPNYKNVAMANLCFQMGADVEDVDELLEMMKSTADTDYIRYDLNGDWDTEDVVRFDTDDGSYIDEINSEEDSDKNIWYTIWGQKLSSQPTKPGVYIHNGNKVVIK